MTSEKQSNHFLTMATCMECRSGSLYTATEQTPIFLAVRITRQAISPLLAMRTFSILPIHRCTKINMRASLHISMTDYLFPTVCELTHGCISDRSVSPDLFPKAKIT